MAKYKYTYNRIFFQKIDTEEKAYWLGFIAADGSIKRETYEIYLEIKNSDKRHLQKFLNSLESNGKVKDTKQGKAARVTVCCKHMGLQLNYLGLTPDKTKKFNFKWECIPDNLMRHFIRGYFDGDGGIGKTNRSSGYNNWWASISGENTFLNELKEKTGFKMSIRNRGGWSELNVSLKDLKNFLDYMYEDAQVYLDRKYELYEKFIDEVESN